MEYLVDFHSPWHIGERNDRVFLVQKGDPRPLNAFAKYFQKAAAEEPGAMDYDPADDVAPGQEWNSADPEFPSASNYAGTRPSMDLAFNLLFLALLAAVGPTASGKTALAVELARRFGGEVISADSMQVYEGMDIATAKPSQEEQKGILHHLIGYVPAEEPYSLARYVEDARAAIEAAASRGAVPILAGGTGLWNRPFATSCMRWQRKKGTAIFWSCFGKRTRKWLPSCMKTTWCALSGRWRSAARRA